MNERNWAKSARAVLQRLKEDEAALREEFTRAVQRMSQGDHYVMLGVPRNADSEAIRDAYLTQIARFHPDRVKPEDLGVDPEQQRKLVIALTTAFDVLKHAKVRESSAGARRATEPWSQRSTVPAPGRLRSRSESQERSTSPPKDAGELPPGSVPVRRFRQLMDGAIAEEQWASAVNLARLALQCEPHDVKLREQLDDLQLKADRVLADKFVAQGRYEEETRDYARAARSFERAANGKGAPEYFFRAAKCLLADGSDDRKAVELARKAVLMDQQVPEYRLVLAEAYLSLGMLQSAIGETTRALEEAPGNSQAKHLLQILRKSNRR